MNDVGVLEEFFDDVWRVNFADKFFFVVDLSLDMLFLNGVRFLTTIKERGYDELFVLRRNRLAHKTRVKTLFWHNSVFAIDVGWDGRVFFKFWKSLRDFKAFRRSPDWVASYFNDRVSKKRFVWVQDLKLPKHVFEVV